MTPLRILLACVAAFREPPSGGGSENHLRWEVHELYRFADPHFGLRGICVALGLAFASCVVHAETVAIEGERYAVLRFDGTKVLPLANQMTLTGGKVPPAENVESQLTYVIAVDRLRQEIFVYTLESLWRIDAVQLGSQSESFHAWGDSGVRVYQDSQWQRGEPGSIWHLGIRPIFGDVLDLPFEGGKADLISTVVSSVKECQIPGVSDAEVRAEWLRHRWVAEDGTQVVANLIHKGSVISAVRAVENERDSRRYSCKSIVFRNGKPWEIRSGTIRLDFEGTLPVRMNELRDELEIRFSPDRLMKDRGVVEVPQSRDSTRLKRSGYEVSELILAASVTIFVLSVVFRWFLIKNGRVSHAQIANVRFFGSGHWGDRLLRL